MVSNALAQNHIPASNVTTDLTYPLLCCPSNAVLYRLLLKIQSCESMRYLGIDKPLFGDRFKMTMTQLTEAHNQIDIRSDYMANKLLEIADQGVIAIIGAAHAERIQKKLIEKLGIEKAQEHFSFIVPYGLLDNPQIDIRSKWLDQLANNNLAPVIAAFPLGKINFFGGMPTTFTEECQSTDQRFQDFVKVNCWNQTIQTTCSKYLLGYLYRLFVSPSTSAATNEYLQIVDRLKKFS
jgi:hypothetical protein